MMPINSLNIRPYNNKEPLLFPPLIGDFLPDDDLAHVVDEAVDEIDLTPYFEKISPVGNPPYHPALMIKIWFYGYASKTSSSRMIEEKTHKDVGFIFLAAMQQPDFKTIAEFRRKNLPELKDSLVDIVQICHRLGMTELGEISIDSKVTKANASASKTYTEKRLIKEREEIEKVVKEYLEKANQTDQEEDEKYGPDNRGNELPEDIRNKEKRIEKVKRVIEDLKQAQEELKESSKKQINLTDKDAQFQKDKGRIIPGYRAEVSVDSKEQIIIASDVTNEQNDSSQLLPMVDETLKNIEAIESKQNSKASQEKEAIKLTADSAYNTGNNLAELEKDKYKERIDPYIPDQKSIAKERGKGGDINSPFDSSKFVYNEKENTFTCPAGRKLDYTGQQFAHGRSYFVYQCKDCKGCQYFGECTTCKQGRAIWVSEYQEIIDKMREKLKTDEGKEIYSRRKTVVEPTLGNLSQNLGFREFSLRGLEKVKGEFSLMCTAHNLRKITRFIGELGVSLKKALDMSQLSPLLDTS